MVVQAEWGERRIPATFLSVSNSPGLRPEVSSGDQGKGWGLGPTGSRALAMALRWKWSSPSIPASVTYGRQQWSGGRHSLGPGARHLGALRSLRASWVLAPGSLREDSWAEAGAWPEGAANGDLPPLQLGPGRQPDSCALRPFPFLSELRTFICLTEIYRNISYLTSRTKALTPESLQQLTMSLPHLSKKRALLKAFGEWGGFKTWATHLLAWPCNKPFSVPS